MVLYALTETETVVSAQHAEKQKNYRCLECHSSVALRSGSINQPHFYHLSLTKDCQQAAKSLTHLQIQLYLLNLLPELKLEERFPEIGRIADACWYSEKIIFEVQCSGITKEEIKKRTDDYLHLGFQVVWILHEKRFQQFSSSIPHYFTNIQEDGKGIIYDQKKIYPVDVRKPTWNEQGLRWPLFFKGDLIDRGLALPIRKNYFLSYYRTLFKLFLRSRFK